MTHPLPSRGHGGVAIVGMACIFPGAPDLQTYWRNIVCKVDAIGDPPDDWGADTFYDPDSSDSDRVYCKRGGYLGDLATFDPLAYGVMPSSVDGGEPDHFLALRVAQEALDDAGYLGEKTLPTARDRVEVILGGGAHVNRGSTNLVQHGLVVDQTLRLLRQLHPEHGDDELAEIRRELVASLPPFNAEMAPGLVPNVLSGRIANRLDLMGPNFTVDAACASSLIAVDRGIQDLLAERCDVALVGGVHCSTPAPIFMIFCQLNALSRQGRIRPFSTGADGTLLGEGLGMVVLKRTADACRDEDRIYAIIKSVGSASDGRAVGLLTPRLEGEELAMRRAYQACGAEPSSIGLVEAHGTGTMVGDETEAKALTRIFGTRDGRPPSCALGSVKSMISHLMPAAGIAGLIKAALALHYKVLPPTLYCEAPNPKLGLDETPLYINSETRPWIHGLPTPRRAGVNAFGFGGINAHAILEEFVADRPAPSFDGGPPWDSEVVLLRASSRAELAGTCRRIGERIMAERSPAALADVAYTLNCPEIPTAGQESCVAVVASSIDDLKRKLDRAAERLSNTGCRRINDLSGVYFHERPLAREGKLAFLFPGDGSQYVNMLADLCLRIAPLRERFDLVDRAFADHARGWLTSQIVFPPPLPNDPETREAQERRLFEMDFSSEAAFAASQGIVAMLRDLGICPQTVLGHSGGDLSALLSAGIIRVTDDAQLVRHIADINRLYSTLSERGLVPQGRAVAVSCVDRDTLAATLRSSDEAVHIAIDNCPNQVVVCGPEAAIEGAVECLRAVGAICLPLSFQRPYHTAAFKPYCSEVRPFFDRLDIAPSSVTGWCASTASPFPKQADAIRELVAHQQALPVRFRETLEAMHDDGVRIFVEVGPKGTLTSFVADTLRRRPHEAIAVDVQGASGVLQLNHVLGRLAAHGVAMRLDPLYERRAARRLAWGITAGSTAVQAKRASGRPMKLATGLTELRLPDRPISLAAAAIDGWHVPAASSPPGNVPATALVAHTARSEIHSPRRDVMDAYLASMERFLSVQHEVIQTYLGGAQPECVPRARSVGDNRNGAIREIDGQATAPTVGVAAAPGPTANPDSVKPGLLPCLLAAISERTGYPPDMLEAELSLEGDLGIDSIKRIEILGAVHRQTGLVGPDRMERVSSLKTIRQIVDFLDGPAPAPAPRTDLLATLPLIGRIESFRRGEEVTVIRELDVTQDLFLNDHALGGHVSATDPALTGLPIVPLTMTVEMMAEAGALLQPGKVLVEMRDIRGTQWLSLDDGNLTLRITARIDFDTLRTTANAAADSAVDVRVADVNGVQVAKALAVFASEYPTPPLATDLDLRSPRPSQWTPERLYRDHMFHGPSFRGIESIERWGENGYEATLKGLPASGLLKKVASPRFLADPVLLDAAGQMVGYWAAEHLATGFNVFPFGIRSLQWYRPQREQGQRAGCRARIRLKDDMQIHADLELADGDGRVVMRASDWQDRRIDFSDAFYQMCKSPREATLSSPLDVPLAPDALGHAVRCSIIETDSLPPLSANGAIWLRTLAHCILSRSERDTWRGLKSTERRRIEWLLGRCCAKDAVTRFETGLFPADIVIRPDERGQPEVSATVLAGRRPPAISIAHADGVAVALAVSPSTDKTDLSVGIDVERLDPSRDGFEEAAFSPDERALLASWQSDSAANRGAEREYALRLWCGKEAAAKALGYGLLGGPGSVLVRAFDAARETISLEVAGPLAERLPHLRGVALTACTGRRGDLVIATCVLTGGYGEA